MPIPAAYGSSRQQKKKQRPFPTYAGTPYSFTQGTSVTITPTIKGDGPSEASISPALPSGLSLNTTTLVISGTPTESSSRTEYTVTATNDGGTSQVQLDLTITAAAPTVTITSVGYTTVSYGNTGGNIPDGSLVLTETVNTDRGAFSANKIGQYFSAADPQKVLTQGTFGYDTTNLSASDLPADGECAIAVDIAWVGDGKASTIWIWRPDAGEEGRPFEDPGPDNFATMGFGNLNRDDILSGRLELMPSASTGFAHYVLSADPAEISLRYRVKIRLADGESVITSDTFAVEFNTEGQTPAVKEFLQASAAPTISNVTLLAFAYADGGDPGSSAPLDPSQQETVTINAGSEWTIEPNEVALFKDDILMEKLYYAWSVTYDSSALDPLQFAENDVSVVFTVNNPAASNKMQYHRDEFADDVLFGAPTQLIIEYPERIECIDGETVAFLLPGFGGLGGQPIGTTGGPYQADNSIIFNGSDEGAPTVTYEFSLTFVMEDGTEIVTDPVTVTVPPNATRNYLV